MVMKAPEPVTRKVSIELAGDDAVLFNTLKVALQLDSSSVPKRESDAHLVQLALMALDKCMEDFKTERGIRFPTPEQLQDYMSGHPSQKLLGQ